MASRLYLPLTATFNLYIANADGSQVRKLTHEKDGGVFYFPSVQADGKKIWFSMAKAEKAVIGYVSPDGKEYKEVAPGRDGAISPDGKKIAFTTRVGKGFPLFVMDADGKSALKISVTDTPVFAVTVDVICQSVG